MADTYALILAGGSGTRFWPLSRDSKPKQLLNLFGDTTLLNQTIDRLSGLIPVENIIILTNQLQEKEVRAVANELPPENIFAEPAKRDTAPAIALGAGLIAARDALVTIGVKATWACPSFGYIERGAQVSIPGLDLKHPPHEVIKFREKPNTNLAEQFLRQGNFSWNAGMFIWSVPTLIKELNQHTPELVDFISEIRESDNIKTTINTQFPELNPISIDYALMENAKHVLKIEATFDWDDVGSWISVSKYLNQDEDHNATNTPLVNLDSHNNIVFTKSNDTQVALLGVDHLIVVQTEDSILVANRHQADDIKKLIQKLPPELK